MSAGNGGARLSNPVSYGTVQRRCRTVGLVVVVVVAVVSVEAPIATSTASLPAWASQSSRERRAHPAPAWTLAAAMIVLNGFSRIMLGVHWASDIAGGTLLGTAFAILGARWAAPARLRLS